MLDQSVGNEKHNCRYITAIIGLIILVVEQLFCIIYGFLRNLSGLGALGIILFCVLIVAAIGLFAGKRAWTALRITNICIAIVVCTAALMGITAFCSIIHTLNSQSTLTDAEKSSRKNKVKNLVILLIIFLLNFIFFIVLYLPMLLLYPKAEEDKKCEEAERIDTTEAS